MPWRRDRLPTPVFLGFPSGSAGKEAVCYKFLAQQLVFVSICSHFLFINSFFFENVLFLVVLSLCCCSGSSLVGGEQGGPSLDAEHRFSIAGASLVAGFPVSLAGKESACSSGDLDLIPGLGRFPGKG